MTIRIVIADDHTVVRRGLRTFLELDPEMVVVGETDDDEHSPSNTARPLARYNVTEYIRTPSWGVMTPCSWAFIRITRNYMGEQENNKREALIGPVLLYPYSKYRCSQLSAYLADGVFPLGLSTYGSSPPKEGSVAGHLAG